MSEIPSSVFRHPVTVEFEDVDCYGIAHHTKLVAYLERARVHFFASQGLDLKNLDIGIVLLDLHVEFKQPLRALEAVDVELRVRSLGRVRLVWDYVAKKGNTVAFKAEIEQAVIDLATKRPVEIPPRIRAMLETLLIREDPGPRP